MFKRSCLSLLIVFIISLFFASCRFQSKIDIWGLKQDARKFEKNFNPGDTAVLTNFLKNNTLETYTKPLHTSEISIHSSQRWKLNEENKVIVEKLTFPSDFNCNSPTDTAVFYIFRQGELSGNKVILWMPGMGVSDFAFGFIKDFFHEELIRGYNIVFYIPPYHLDRKNKNAENGEGYFGTDTHENITHFLISLRELRTVIEYLQNKNVKSIGAWGGSMGSSMELLLAQFVDFEHICAMLPIVDWYTLIVNNYQMKNVTNKLLEAGYSETLLKQAYSMISPEHYQIKINPEKSLFLCGRYDQIARLETVEKYALKNGINNKMVYNRSHATILISRKMFKDYGKFLDSLK